MNSRNPKILYQGQPGTINTELYVVPLDTKATITGILASNTNIDAKKLSIYLVKNGNTIGDEKLIAKDQKLIGTSSDFGGGTWTMEFPIPLQAGDKLIGIQEETEAINVFVVGFEEGVS